jgi:hypothetical protein
MLVMPNTRRVAGRTSNLYQTTSPMPIRNSPTLRIPQSDDRDAKSVPPCCTIVQQGGSPQTACGQAFDDYASPAGSFDTRRLLCYIRRGRLQAIMSEADAIFTFEEET